MSKHALLSASGSHRWLLCPPSAKFELNFPSKTTSYASEGTEAHTLCEMVASYFLGEITEDDYENKLEAFKQNEYYSAEMQECAVDYATLIRNKVNDLKKTCEDTIVELEAENLDFSKWVPEGFGTGDCIIVADNTLEIIDFKYGKGYAVSAENNSQMRLYALGAVVRYQDFYDIDKVVMTIYQPRITKMPLSEEITVKELLKWADTFVKPRAKLAFAGQGDFNPSKSTCKFCRANRQCKARADQNLALFDDNPDTLTITPDEAGKILEKADDIKTWLADLEKLVFTTIIDGKTVDGWKVVEGKSNRALTDTDRAVKALVKAGIDEDKLYEKSLLSLAKIEKAFGKKKVDTILEKLIIKPEGKPTLAPFSDKREAIQPDKAILAAFDEAEEND
jgi:hypothetical protein